MHAHPRRDERGRLDVAQVFRDHARAYLAANRLPRAARVVLTRLSRCRTAALGGHVEVCSDCGHRHVAYNSCRDRHCPTCQPGRQRRWVEERQARVLPTHHFHVVFTLPGALRSLARCNPREVYEALISCAARTLLELGERRLGGQLGVTTVLHTWTRDLRLHPHVHCVVTGGALGPDGTWTPTRPRFLFPVAVMRDLFRGKLLARLQRLVRAGDLVLPDDLRDGGWDRLRDQLYRSPWVVYAKRPFGGARQVYAYLGRYTHRVAISSARLHAYDGRRVTFRTRGDDRVTLEAPEFLRRFLLHVLPRGLRKIRHHGLLAPASVNTRLVLARRHLDAAATRDDEAADEITPEPWHPSCRGCGGRTLVLEPLAMRTRPSPPDTS